MKDEIRVITDGPEEGEYSDTMPHFPLHEKSRATVRPAVRKGNPSHQRQEPERIQPLCLLLPASPAAEPKDIAATPHEPPLKSKGKGQR